LNEAVCLQHMQYCRGRANPFIIVFPVPPTQDMLHPIHGSKLSGDVSAWGLVVAEDRTETKYGIVAFKDLSRVTDGWPKPANILFEMDEQMQLHFHDDLGWIDIAECIENICNNNLKVRLIANNVSHPYLQMNCICSLDMCPCYQFQGSKALHPAPQLLSQVLIVWGLRCHGDEMPWFA